MLTQLQFIPSMDKVHQFQWACPLLSMLPILLLAHEHYRVHER